MNAAEDFANLHAGEYDDALSNLTAAEYNTVLLEMFGAHLEFAGWDYEDEQDLELALVAEYVSGGWDALVAEYVSGGWDVDPGSLMDWVVRCSSHAWRCETTVDPDEIEEQGRLALAAVHAYRARIGQLAQGVAA